MWTVPNIITLIRICFTPVIALLPFVAFLLLFARLVDRLTAAGARAIAFDIVFSDPNPQQPASDDQFIQAVKRSGKVVLAADNVPSGPKAKRIVPPFDSLLDSAVAMGSAEVIPDGDLVVREHTPEEQVPSLSWAAARPTPRSTT